MKPSPADSQVPATTRAYWVEEPKRGALRIEPTVPAGTTGAESRPTSVVRADFGGISPGTERLIGRGEAPSECTESMACRYMAGSFDLPVKYGYCVVGTGVTGALAGQRVFVMHPHQEWLTVRDRDVVLLPDSVPGPRATLLPNLETALNAVWDSEASPHESALVLGAGPVGLLVALVRKMLGQGETTIVDRDPDRRAIAAALGWGDRVLAPTEIPNDPGFPLAFHATGHGEGLQTAIDALAFEGRVIELSWFGSRPVQLRLGAAFHHRRLSIRASQVGSVAPSARDADGGYTRRTAAVLDLLEDRRLDALLTTPFAFDELPERMHSLYADRPLRAGIPLAPVLAYPAPELDATGDR